MEALPAPQSVEHAAAPKAHDQTNGEKKAEKKVDFKPEYKPSGAAAVAFDGLKGEVCAIACLVHHESAGVHHDR